MQVVASVSRVIRPPFILGLLAVSIFLVNAKKRRTSPRMRRLTTPSRSRWFTSNRV
jgi:hypothetical protein